MNVGDNPIVFEVDDISNGTWNKVKGNLLKFKEEIPLFKATIWCIYNFCSYDIMQDISNCNWIQHGIHGISHTRKREGKVEETGGECDQWTYNQTLEYISLSNQHERFEHFNYGFKAPWYYIGGTQLKAFKNNGTMFVATHPRYTQDVPPGLKVYEFCKYKGQIRTHPVNNCGDGIEENYDLLLGKLKHREVFKYCSELIKES